MLWDGYKQLHGIIEFRAEDLSFSLLDFKETDLQLIIPFRNIKKVCYHKLYALSIDGVEVQTNDNKVNVFVVENAAGLRKLVEERIKYLK